MPDLSLEAREALKIAALMETRVPVIREIAAALLEAEARGIQWCADAYVGNASGERDSAGQRIRKYERQAQVLREGSK